jgi:hypothetical protein
MPVNEGRANEPNAELKNWKVLRKIRSGPSRAYTRAASNQRPGSIQRGGSVEVFAEASSATIRQQRLAQLENNPPLLGSEYTFTNGPALLRVSGRLTPAQAAEYAAAFRS